MCCDTKCNLRFRQRFSLSESILPAAQKGEGFDIGSGLLPGPPGNRPTYWGFGGAQERINSSFKADGGRQCRLVTYAQFTYLLLVSAAIGVVRLYRECEAQIRGGVFVPAVNRRFRRQGGEARERIVQLCRGAFKQPSAAGGKQGVAAKQQPMTVISNMAGGMAGYIEHVELESERVEADAIAAVQAMGQCRDMFLRRAIHRHVVMRQQFLHAADMVAVMVGAKDGGGREALFCQCVEHRRGVAGVDDGYPVRQTATDQPDIVVLEGADV